MEEPQIPLAPETLPGSWCWHPDYPSGAPEFTLFRLAFRTARQRTVRLLFSADNRCNLFLDGVFVGRGPARGDLEHYRYESCTLELPPGSHILAAEVIVYPCGFREEEGPWSEIHTGGGFLILSGDAAFATPGSWRCRRDASRRHRKWRDSWNGRGGIPAPPMEEYEPDPALTGWKLPEFDDSDWPAVRHVGEPYFADRCKTDPPTRWRLVPGTTPPMRQEPVAVRSILAGNEFLAPDGSGGATGRIPAGKHTILLDLGRYRTSLVHLRFSGGKGVCRIGYAEALFRNGVRTERGPVPGGRVGEYGFSDLLKLNGADGAFDSFWYRSGRFVELAFELDAPLAIERLSFEFVAYPFDRKAVWRSPERPVLERIFETAWHTARCCAHEHYEDCPYWEQLQYAGDTRIQALISYLATGDARLGRQAVRQFDESRLGGGLTASRYPSNFRQIIPGFSLYWIMMAGDCYDYTGDQSVIAEHRNGIRDVLEYFSAHRDGGTGLIGPVPGWNFSDWAAGWPDGRSSRGEELPETLLNLLYAEACRVAGRLFRAAGIIPGHDWEAERQSVLAAVNRHCFDQERRRYTDVPGKAYFSCHVNAWAILAGAADSGLRTELSAALTEDPGLTGCTLYFAFYLLEAMHRTGNDAGFETVLKQWEPMLELGFTTFPECPSADTRSDCHAWSAGPLYHLLRHYAGVYPAEPGYAVVGVEPAAGAPPFTAVLPVGGGRLLTVSGRPGDGCTLSSASRLRIRRKDGTEFDLKPGEPATVSPTAPGTAPATPTAGSEPG